MNKGFGFSAVALAFSLGALPFGSIAEEVPPPPPQEQPQPPCCNRDPWKDGYIACSAGC